jgi:type I restriction enzyme, S subunit
VEPAYLALVLRTKSFLSVFEGLAHGGSTKTRIPPEEFERQEIPLPPLAEQAAIVARWQDAQTQIAAARARVEAKKAEIDARFFADLGLHALPQTTLPRCFAVWWKDFLRWSVSYSQQTGLDISQGKFCIVELGSILDLVQYGTSEKANSIGNGVAVVRMNNIVEGEFDLSNLKHLPLPQAEVEKLLLKEGDILFNRTNSKELVGKCAVFHAAGDYVFASYLIRVRANPSKADVDFLAHVVNSPIGRGQINALSRQIIGQANVNTEELRSLQIPLPPLSIQRKIVARVQTGRAEIAREREVAARLSREVTAEIEALILGETSIQG